MFLSKEWDTAAAALLQTPVQDRGDAHVMSAIARETSGSQLGPPTCEQHSAISGRLNWPRQGVKHYQQELSNLSHTYPLQ